MTFPKLNPEFLSVPDDRVHDYLLDRVAQVGEERVTLTPALAAAILEMNTNNRPLREARVETLATEVREGRFMYTGETISFLSNGALSNGQHRCRTVIKTGVAVPALLVYGLDPEAQKYQDSQAPRSSADVIGMMGFRNANEVNAISGYLQKWERDNEIPTNSGRKATRGQRIEYVEDQGERITAALDALPATKGKALASRSILGTCYARFTKATDPRQVSQFINALLTGENLAADDPILVARNTLLGWQGQKGIHANKYFDLIVQAWNAWRRGERVKRAFSLRGTLHAVEA